MKRRFAEEQMDAADLAADDYAAVLADLAAVNRLTMTHRPTIGFLKRVVQGSHPGGLKLLDVGFGQGDMLRRIAVWAKRQGIPAMLVGVDLNPNSAPAARAATPQDLAIDYRTGDYADLAGEGWDIIVSSLVTHHMDDAQRIAFLRFMEAEARIGWLVNDLHRHRLAWIGFPILARIMRWHRIVREDGQLSVARSFTADEWRADLAKAGIADAKVVRRFPFRLCVERLR